MAEAPAAAPPRGSSVDRVTSAMAAEREVERPIALAWRKTAHMAAEGWAGGMGEWVQGRIQSLWCHKAASML